ncbi:MAG: aspartate aminotransferase family protein [Salinispira sp.]
MKNHHSTRQHTENQHSPRRYAENHHLPRQYAENLLIMEDGNGVRIRDAGGKEYLDFASGIAVNSLGYGRKDFAHILASQAEKLMHTSNLFTSRPTLELAAKLCSSSPIPEDQPWESGKNPAYFSAVHFGNSGAEANEAALKYARLWHHRQGRQAHMILAFHNGFHGRTMGALSLTSEEKYRLPFHPLLPGVVFARFNDPDDMKKTIAEHPQIGAIIVEPIQGESGLNTMTADFAAQLNTVCSTNNILLIADEVQTGIGRCAALYASEIIGLKPDIITLSKPLAGGLPLSATLIGAKINDLLTPGDHGSTFGGGPVSCVVANAVWDIINAPEFLSTVRSTAEHFEQRLLNIQASFPRFFSSEVPRGLGLLRGLAVKDPSQLPLLISRAIDRGLLILRSGNNILRFAPPLIITPDEIGEMETRLQKALGDLE